MPLPDAGAQALTADHHRAPAAALVVAPAELPHVAPQSFSDHHPWLSLVLLGAFLVLLIRLLRVVLKLGLRAKAILLGTTRKRPPPNTFPMKRVDLELRLATRPSG